MNKEHNTEGEWQIKIEKQHKKMNNNCEENVLYWKLITLKHLTLVQSWSFF